jgi:hypothetical protein
LLYKERFVWLNDEEKQIYDQHFALAMTKPEFGQLVRVGNLSTAQMRTDVIHEGQIADLVLVIDGQAEVTVGAGVIVPVIRAGLLGESSYTRGSAATKSVSVLPGCRYIVWPRVALKELLERKPSIQRGLELVIAKELSRKLGETSSRLIQASSGARDGRIHHENVTYGALIMRFALHFLADEQLSKESKCQDFFKLLSDCRLQEGITSEVHIRTMKRLGIDEDTCIQEDTPLHSIFVQIASSPIPGTQVKVEKILLKDAEQKEDPCDVSYKTYLEMHGPVQLQISESR